MPLHKQVARSGRHYNPNLAAPQNAGTRENRNMVVDSVEEGHGMSQHMFSTHEHSSAARMRGAHNSVLPVPDVA